VRRVSGSTTLATAVLLVVVACSGPTSSGRGSTAATASGTATVFHRLGYRFAVPTGWQSREGSLDWEQTGGPPRLAVPTFDAFFPPSEDPRILVGKRPVRNAAPLDRWIAQLRAGHLITYDPETCSAAEDQRSTTLGGAPAQMVAFHCPTDGPKAGAVQLLARHGDSGWVVQCFSGDGIAGPLTGLEKQCTTWLSSFRFVP
jgi:hypothetical protein